MKDQGALEWLASTPLDRLCLRDKRIQRRIIKSGFNNILELLSLTDSEIDEKFCWRDADYLIELKDRLESDPSGLVRLLSRERRVALSGVTGSSRVSDLDEGRRVEGHRSVKNDIRFHRADEGPLVLPDRSFSAKLLASEKKAKSVFDGLSDHYDSVMVYQSFDEFATELDEIESAFQALFENYKNRPRYAVLLIDKYLRNVFLIYVSDRARNDFDGGNLWGNLFGRIGVKDPATQSEFKDVFVRQLKRRKMPLYEANEETRRYYYTALLHGGLSGDSWESLWHDSIFPLVKADRLDRLGFGSEADGRMVLKEIKNPSSEFAPKKTVLNILEKAPDSTIVPLIESALKVASQVEAANGKQLSECTMLTSFGLPDAAMQSLLKGRGMKRAAGRGTRPRDKNGFCRTVYLPEAKLQLDLAEGLVSLRWVKQQFPTSFVGTRIDYYVDGDLRLTQGFEPRVGKAILPESEIQVKPQVRYDVELRLLRKREGGSWDEIGTLSQSFSRSKPGCFEFLQESGGAFRLRRHNERIRRRRRIAYVLKKGFEIEHGQGMFPVSEYDAGDSWAESRIFLYDVDPGASGSIVDTETGECEAVWQERYSANVDKGGVIGETSNGLDLYGFVPGGLGTNCGLPSFSIEAVDGLAALEDLDVVCLCDGERVSIPRHVVWEGKEDSSPEARMLLFPSQAIFRNSHIELCEVVARQRSDGNRAVFRYRFSVVPIQGFKLASMEFLYGEAIARYQFQSKTHALITDSQSVAREVEPSETYDAVTLLRDEFLSVRIRSIDEKKVTDAKLALAALIVDLPKRLKDISRDRPICLADALNLGEAGGNVNVTSLGWRHDRAILLRLGFIPKFFKELKAPRSYSFNLFSHAKDFVQGGGAPEKKSLELSVCYGTDVSQDLSKPAWTDAELLSCVEGLGFSSWRFVVKRGVGRVLILDSPTLHDIRLEFRRKVGGTLVGTADLEEGHTEVCLPQAVVRCLDTQRKLTMTICPVDWTGDLCFDLSCTVSFDR